MSNANEAALEKIINFAESIGYRIDGYVIPLEPAPAIKIDPETMTATCPHCKAVISEESDWLLEIESSYSGSSAYPICEEEDQEPYWNISQGDLNRETVGYQCPACYGWVTPSEEVVW